ncbi:Elongation factor G [Luteitalea pratensis]|uniref:Elongation factor G n=1 Tax=Luteitalea pratensis TaxID=1855912 RepID=A0A143PSI3_LUTPR|nr:elongation factor G [Luteitalea pratensis]AMY11595.1 Elongation factor G [Luteitalea pratensis]
MPTYAAASIRNVAVVGHNGSGKTQLISAVLFTAGATTRLGRVDDGTAPTDFDEEAIVRKHTLAATPAWLDWHGTKVNLVDTPGFGNFLSETGATLRVTDAALVVVDAVAGVEVQTERVWALANDERLAKFVVVNRLDRERASFVTALEDLHAAFGRSLVPVQLPYGEEKGFRGVIDLVAQRAYTYEGGTGRGKPVAIPESIAAEAKNAREALVELVAEADDDLMSRFFDEGTLSDDELVAGLRTAVRTGAVVPVFCASGAENIGTDRLLEALVHYTPSPVDRPLPAIEKSSGDAITTLADESGPTRVFVWKTVADPFAGRISLFRVVTGIVRNDSTLTNLTRGTQERIAHLMALQGKTQAQVTELHAGDLGAIAKLKDAQTGDTLSDRAADLTLPPIAFAAPLMSYALEPKSRGDEDKISTALHRLQEEDPTIRTDRDPRTHEQLISGQGQMHLEVTVAKLKRRFGVDVTLKLPRIPYLETITASTEAHGRHKKQTGGHGQFGDCKIRVEPLPRGADFQFEDDIFGGSIPRQYVPAVEKGIQEARTRGFLAGFPMVDFKATVFDGSFHPVDSNELAFKMAGSIAFRDAMTRARPVLLEPIMQVEVHAPNEFAGDLMGDLNGRRGRISGMEARGHATVIKAQVPMSEMLTYEQHLTSATGGRGSYHMAHSHYEEVPAHLQAKIVAAHKTEHGVEHSEA